tara:strand:- start:1528 stop:1674 length:147 start_codon:yes stop_codon:yes gene_type:complete
MLALNSYVSRIIFNLKLIDIIAFLIIISNNFKINFKIYNLKILKHNDI